MEKGLILKKDTQLAKASNEKLLKDYSPANCLRLASKVRTIDKAINSESPTLGTFQRVKGRDFTEGMVMGWLVYLNDILGLNKPMSDDQIEMCAIEVVNEFYMLKFSDLTLLFKRIISGQHGEFYERLSIPKVLTFFREYLEERCDVAGQQSLREHQDEKSIDTFNISKNVRRILNNGARSK